MCITVDVTIPVDESAATDLRNVTHREAIGRLVSRILERRRRNAGRLLEVMDRFGAEAREAGLTDEILEEELAAYNAERRA